jgi:hypothetical protein
MRGQGNLPLARTSAEAVIRDARALDLRDVEAMAYADLGVVCELQGNHVEGVQAHYRAFLATEDTLQRMRVLGDLGIGLKNIGAHEPARLAFELVVASNTSFLVRTNALLELMALESLVGNQVAFERRRVQAEDSRDRMPPSMAADFHFKAGLGLAQFGRVARAKAVLGQGRELAEAHQLNAWYFKFERAVQDVDGLGAREPAPVSSAPTLSESPAVLEVADGLREYASMAI